MEKNSLLAIGYIIIALLVVNTFFLGGIWCALKHCGISGASAKICPISIKTLESKMQQPEAVK